MEYGWICPRCNIVNAPHLDMCKNCLPTKEEQEEFAKQRAKTKGCYADEQKALMNTIKSLDWIWGNTSCRVDSEIDWTSGELLLPRTDGRTLRWDNTRFYIEKINGSPSYDVAWKNIAAWWIAPPLNDKDCTIVVRGNVSGSLYSFDVGNSCTAQEFIENVFRHYVKDKEIQR